jgi:uncharacterized protein YaeQ
MKALALALALSAPLAQAVDLGHSLQIPGGVDRLQFVCSQARMFAVTAANGRDAGVTLEAMLQWVDYHASNYASVYPDDQKMMDKAEFMRGYIKWIYDAAIASTDAANKLERDCIANGGDTERFAKP